MSHLPAQVKDEVQRYLKHYRMWQSGYWRKPRAELLAVVNLLAAHGVYVFTHEDVVSCSEG